MIQRILVGDVRERLRSLPDQSVHCVVTSPPYFGLRDYGVAGQIGLEPTLADFIATMVDVFREVWRVLRDDGTLWLNLGDSYANDTKWGGASGGKHVTALHGNTGIGRQKVNTGLKPKDLMGVPWRVAFALQDDGWYLRSDIIWAKPNPMPESVTDRPTKGHEYLFLLTKQPRYFYDADAVREEHAAATIKSFGNGGRPNARAYGHADHQDDVGKVASGNWGASQQAAQQGRFVDPRGRNKRTVWTIPTAPFPQAHFATFPPALVEPCIKAGTSEKGVCPVCGAPWKRVTQKVATGATQKMADGWDTGKGGHGTIHRNGRESGAAGVPVMAAQTIRWDQSCKCPALDPIPATLLDPFAGSGTTMMVANRLGRNGIGVELNPEYAQMAADRIKRDDALFVDVTVEAHE